MKTYCSSKGGTTVQHVFSCVTASLWPSVTIHQSGVMETWLINISQPTDKQFALRCCKGSLRWTSLLLRRGSMSNIWSPVWYQWMETGKSHIPFSRTDQHFEKLQKQAIEQLKNTSCAVDALKAITCAINVSIGNDTYAESLCTRTLMTTKAANQKMEAHLKFQTDSS